MPDENKTSDSLEQGIDSSIDKALAAKSAYDAAQNIGAAAVATGQAAAEGTAAAGAGAAASGAGAAAGGPARTVLGAVIGLAVSLLAKPVIKGIIVAVLFLLMVFLPFQVCFLNNPWILPTTAAPRQSASSSKITLCRHIRKRLKIANRILKRTFSEESPAGSFRNTTI